MEKLCFPFVILFTMCIACSSAFSINSNDYAKYSTKGHSKAYGLNIVLEYPKNWVAEEGNRPHIVQKFSGKMENNIMPMCLIMIQDTGSMSDDDFARDTLSAQPKDLLPPGATLLNWAKTKYDGQPGYWISGSMKTERAGISAREYFLSHNFIYSGRIVSIQCAVIGYGDERDIYAAFKHSLPIFILIGNSIVIHDKWNQVNKISNNTPSDKGDNTGSIILVVWLVLSVLVVIWAIILRRDAFWSVIGCTFLSPIAIAIYYLIVGPVKPQANVSNDESQSKMNRTTKIILSILWIIMGVVVFGYFSSSIFMLGAIPAGLLMYVYCYIYYRFIWGNKSKKKD